MPAPVALVILDGFGCAPEGPGNAVRLARTPVFDALWERWPHTTLIAAGRAVGLPEGQMGNSEVGHLNIGAGRIVAQDLVRISDAVADGTLAENPALQAALRGCQGRSRRAARGRAGLRRRRALARRPPARDRARRTRGGRATRRGARLHGRPRRLAPSGGRPARPARRASGRARARSSRPSSGATTRWIATIAPSAPSSRARHWWTAWGSGPVSASAAVEASYAKGLTDEFITPVMLGDTGLRIARGDPLVFFNFRPDRARQICHALLPTLGVLVTMTRYDETLGARVAFDDAPLTGTLADAAGGCGPAPAARRRDREVRARDVLLRWRERAPPQRRGLGARGVAARCPHLRPRSRDGRRGRRTLLRRASRRRVRLRGRQPRQSRHGRAHGSPAGSDRRQSRPPMRRSA